MTEKRLAPPQPQGDRFDGIPPQEEGAPYGPPVPPSLDSDRQGEIGESPVHKERSTEPDELGEPRGSRMETPALPVHLRKRNTCRIMFIGQGYKTWDDSVRGRKIWLNWWVNQLGRITQDWGRITTLMSPSENYDGWVKMVAREMQVKGECIDPGSRATLRQDSYQESMDILRQYLTQTEEDEEVISIASRTQAAADSAGESDRSDGEIGNEQPNSEGPVLQGMLEEGRSSPGVLSDSESVQEHRVRLVQGAIAELTATKEGLEAKMGGLRKGQRKGYEEGTSTPRKAIKKEKHQDYAGVAPRTDIEEEDPTFDKGEHRQSLRAILAPHRVNLRLCGTSMITWVGDPWDLGGDALIVTMDRTLHVLNSDFRQQLQRRFGRHYQKELSDAQNQMDGDKTTPVVTSGGQTQYHSIIHVTLRDIKPGEDLPSYRSILTQGLEAGIRRAAEHHSRRTVLCTDAIRPDSLDWKEAEKIIQAMERYMYENTVTGEYPCDIVQVTLPKQIEERRSKMLADLDQLTLSKSKRQCPGTYEEGTGPSEGKPTDQEQGMRSDSNRGSEREEDEEERPAVGEYNETEAGGSRNKNIELSEPPPHTIEGARGKTSRSAPVNLPQVTPRRGQSTPQWSPEQAEEGSSGPGTLVTRGTRPRGSEAKGGSEGEDSLPSVSSKAEKRMKLKKMIKVHHIIPREAVEMFDITNQSYKVARDSLYGPLKASRGRELYVPEVGQKVYRIPADWKERGEERLFLKVGFKKREWANILMMPSASSIMYFGNFTNNFKDALIQGLYDALRYRLKPVVVQAAYRAIRQGRRATSDEDQEEGPEPPGMDPCKHQSLQEECRPADPSDSKEVGVSTIVGEPANTDLEGLKILNLVVSTREPAEDRVKYLKRVWPQVRNNNSCNDAAKRLWLGKVMSEAVDCSDTALAHYSRMVVSIEVDEEEELIQQSKEALEQGQTLASIWHQVNSKIATQRVLVLV